MRIATSSRSEEGAVAIIVTLGLLVIFGMTALVVDVGGLLTTKRRMVSAADAAALAAAQSCATNKGLQATAQADALAKENVDSATQLAAPTYTGCSSTSSSGSVDVSYTTMADLAFAPVLGLPNQTDVPAGAKAIWGPTGGGASVPLQLNANSDGSFPCTTTGTECNIYFDNKFDTASSSDWGFLSLDTSSGGWPTSVAGNSTTRTCPAPGTNDIRDWITGGGVEVSLVQDPSLGPTYVCARDGQMGSSSGLMFDTLKTMIDKIFLFPVNQPPKIEINGREKYAIVGFIPLMITAIYAGDDPAAYGSPADAGDCTERKSFSPGPASSKYPAGPLQDGCAIAHPPPGQVDSTPTVYCGDQVDASQVATPGVEYTWDAITRIVTWLFPAKPCGQQKGNPKPGGSQTATIAFHWTSPAVDGTCAGVFAPDPNAFCITTEFAGPLVTGTNPNPDAPDFGARAIRLSS